MTNRVSTKRALALSLLSMLLCVSMLIGSTYAWFTDTATTAVNKIQAGTLDVALEMSTDNGVTWKNAEGKTLNFMTTDNRKEILWEPGCTYSLPKLRVVNKGNLSLKYEIVITGIDGDAELNKAIEWTLPAEKTGNLAAGATSATIAISGHMKETAGNEYQGKSIDGIAITVYATQYTDESDSNGNDYDKDATFYPVIDAAGLKNALANGGNITIDRDVAFAPVIADKTQQTLVAQTTVTKDTLINLAGKKIGVQHDETTDFGKATPLLMAVTDGVLTIDGDGEINCEAGSQQVYGINVNGGKVIVNSGNYYGALTAIQVQKGSLEINGGFFDMAPTCKAAVPQYAKYVVNCIDPAYKNGTATISIKGGTFVNFDPSANPEGEGTSYVAEGYSVVSETQENGDIWYTVVKGTGVVAGTQEDMNKGITDSASKDVTVVMPKNSKVTLDNGLANEGTKSRDITFVGDGTQTVDVASKATSAEGGMLNYQRGSTFTFENLMIQGGEGNFDGIVCDELVYKNCTIKGKLTIYGKATFINCVFENDMANQYSIWTWGGTDVTFEGCTFNTNGKAILLYGQATEAKPTNLVVKNCTFNDRKNGAAGKAAIEIGNDYNATYTLTVENATVNGFADGKNTGSKLWANKNSMDAAHLTVKIDGTEVQ